MLERTPPPKEGYRGSSDDDDDDDDDETYLVLKEDAWAKVCLALDC